MQFFELKIPMVLAELFMKIRLPILARALLFLPEFRHSNNRRLMRLIWQCTEQLGKTKLARDYEAKLLRLEQRKTLERGDVPLLLRQMARLESLNRVSLQVAADKIIDLVSSVSGREELRGAVEDALDEQADSLFLFYLHMVCLAKGGAYVEANDRVIDAIKSSIAELAEPDGKSSQDIKQRTSRLINIWRVVDGIARDNMDWADGKEGFDYDFEIAGFIHETGKLRPAKTRNATAFHFKELLLQGRKFEKYLVTCKREFEEATSLNAKIGSINSILRPGLRRLATYHEAYETAHAWYKELHPLWQQLLEDGDLQTSSESSPRNAIARVRQLCGVLDLARKLNYADDIAVLEDKIIEIAADPENTNTIWTVAANIVEHDPFHPKRDIVNKLVEGASRDPQAEYELRGFLVWALKTRSYQTARDLYQRLPSSSRRLRCMMHYVRILQREGCFAEARKLTREIHAKYLMKLNLVDAVTSWELVRREGELKFAAETANWFQLIPQPNDPKGVIMIAPRSIEQLRKLPLVVLMEMKRLGWAVIPLIEGILPNEPTGVAEIDIFIECCTVDRCLTYEASEQLEPIKDFEADLAHGKLRWDDIDMSHPLWEDAAVNRRRYNVDFTCPELIRFLGNTAAWTELTAVALENARRVFAQRKLRCGFMVSFQARLPDVLVRYYCERRGDAQDFFCIHAANGYQNYFTNFATSVSTKIAVRNMTRHKETRSASFPVPDEFQRFYTENAASAPAMLEMVRDVTKVRRSTAGQKESLPEAQLCAARIKEWIDGGGKVVCAFGKVVCDSSVPFDGGPAHKDMKDWINHTIESVTGSRSLLLIKPHPHERNNQIASFLTEHFEDLIEKKLPDNAMIMGHNWFDIHDLLNKIDLGLIYNGTTAVELGVLGIPAVLCSHFAPIDYPVGHIVPKNRDHYRRLVRFEEPAKVLADLREKSACWLYYMSSDKVTLDYRYHARQVTNKVLYPSWWFKEDIERYFVEGDMNVSRVAEDIAYQEAFTNVIKAQG